MMNKFLKTFAIFSLTGIIVAILLVGTYVYYDPFKVVRKYQDYSYPHVISNRDYISTEMFIQNDKKYHYNSFVFGSSRTMAFTPDSWENFLHPGTIPFMFDASAESIYGIDIKLRYLDSMHIPLDHVLLIFDRDVIFKTTENSSEHLYIKHPLLSGQNRLAFQFAFFKAYLDLKFLYHFYDFTLTGKYKSNMNGFLENRKIKYDTITNQMKIIDQETEISQQPDEYYRKRRNLFYKRSGEQTDSIRRIQKPQLNMLMDLKRILEKDHTDYKIILSPLYEQVKFNKHDLEILEEIFPGHIYNFSGKNGFTDKITNYYETAHFRPVVGDSILKIIY